MTDTDLLWQLIDAKGLKRRAVGEAIGMSYQSFLNKIRNESEFTATEIQRLCAFLGITSLEEKERIFFAENVDLKSTGGDKKNE